MGNLCDSLIGFVKYDIILKFAGVKQTAYKGDSSSKENDDTVF